MNAVTAEYQSTLPFTLIHVSPGLAALHATRYRLLYPSDPSPLQATHCSKCGSFLLSGQGEVRVKRVTRAKRGTPFRVLRRTCQTCGSHDDLPLERGNAALYPKRKRVASLGQGNQPMVSRTLVPDESPAATPLPKLPPSSSTTSTLPKARPKKKSGLQAMLARNREREEKEKQERQSISGGLAAYLAEL